MHNLLCQGYPYQRCHSQHNVEPKITRHLIASLRVKTFELNLGPRPRTEVDSS